MSQTADDSSPNRPDSRIGVPKPGQPVDGDDASSGEAPDRGWPIESPQGSSPSMSSGDGETPDLAWQDPDSGQEADSATSGQLAQRLVVGLVGVSLLAFILIQLKVVLLPMVLAFLVCCVLNPLVETFTRWRLPRFAAIVMALALGLGLAWLIVNYIFSSLSSFKEGFPRYAGKIEAMADYLTNAISGRFDSATMALAREQISQIPFESGITALMDQVMSLTGHLTLTLLLTLYFLPALPTLPSKLRNAFTGRRGEKIGDAVLAVIHQVQRYVLAKTLLSLGLGLAVTLACQAFRVDFTATWGIFAFFLNFIPNLGVPVATLPPVLVCLVQYGPGSCLKLLIVLLALQVVSGNLIEPRVLGRSVDLSPTATLLALLVWGWIWGLSGMILAVPLMAVVKLTCQNFPSLRPIAALMGR